jgi:hypothetical protein
MATRNASDWRGGKPIQPGALNEMLRGTNKPHLTHRLFLKISQVNWFDAAAVLLMAALVVAAFVTFKDYAVSNDEGVQHHYGELILSYYSSGFTDRSLFQFDNLYLYGGLFDIIAVTLSHHLPINAYDLRHILCALIGIGGIGATWATARLLAGPRAALVAAAALALCGAWYGGMFNHTKDIPLAAAMMGALYFVVLISRELPHPRWAHVLGFGLLSGVALGIKVVALLLLVYLGIAVLLRLKRPIHGNVRANFRFALAASVALLPAIFIAYVIMIAAWPWAALSPLNPIRGVFSFAEFHYHIRTLLDGQQYEMATVPRSYIPIYLAIRVPLITLLGAAIAMVFLALPGLCRKFAGAERRDEIALVAFAVFFPIACQVVGHGPAFTGMRHFLFVLPPLSILAGIGVDWTVTALAAWRQPFALAASGLAGLTLVANAVDLVRLHPYEYLSYNSLVGGLPGASGRYAMDYWVNIMPTSVRQLETYLHPAAGQRRALGIDSYKVAVCGERVSFAKEAAQDRDLQWTPDWPKADFFIAPTHMNCDRALDGKVIATIERLGVTIGVVKDRRAITRPRIGKVEATQSTGGPAVPMPN